MKSLIICSWFLLSAGQPAHKESRKESLEVVKKCSKSSELVPCMLVSRGHAKDEHSAGGPELRGARMEVVQEVQALEDAVVQEVVPGRRGCKTNRSACLKDDLRAAKNALRSNNLSNDLPTALRATEHAREHNLSHRLQSGENFTHRPEERRGAVTGGRREVAKNCTHEGHGVCMDKVRSFVERTMEKLHPDETPQKKRKRAEKELHHQQAEIAGSLKAACIKAADSNESKEDARKRCKQQACTEVANFTSGSEEGNCKDLFHSNCVSLFVEAADQCLLMADEAEELQVCLDDYVESTEDSCPQLDQGNQLQHAYSRVAAQRWADCGDETNSTCEGLAKQAWLALSSVAESAADSAWAKQQRRVKYLVQAEREGIPTVFRMLPAVDVLVEVRDSEGACNAATTTDLDSALPQEVIERDCLVLVGDRSLHKRRIHSKHVETTIAEATAGINTLNGSRRLLQFKGARRLAVVVTDSSSSQSAEECFEDDAGCGTMSDATVEAELEEPMGSSSGAASTVIPLTVFLWFMAV